MTFGIDGTRLPGAPGPEHPPTQDRVDVIGGTEHVDDVSAVDQPELALPRQGTTVADPLEEGRQLGHRR